MAKNTMLTAGMTFLSAALGFVVTPVLLHRLGTAPFGVWQLGLSVIGYLGLVETGVGTATVTRVAAEETKGSAAVSRILGSSTLLYLLAGGVLLVALLPVVVFAPVLFHVPASQIASTRFLLVILGLWQTGAFLSNVYTAALYGTGRLGLNAVVGFLVSALVAGLQVLGVVLGFGLPALGASLILGTIATLSVQRLMVRRYLSGVTVSVARAERGTCLRLLSLGWRNGTLFVAGSLGFGSDLLVLGLMIGPKSVAIYALAQKPVKLARAVGTQLANALTPTYANAAQDSASRIFRIYCAAVSFSWLLAIPLAAGLIALGHQLLALWLGRPPRLTYEVMVVLVTVLVVQTPGSHAFTLLVGSERARLLTRLTLGSAALNLVASVLLTRIAGTPGPALGSLMAVVALDTFFLPWLIAKECGQPVRTYFARTVVRLAPATVVTAGVAVAAHEVLRGAPPWAAVPTLGALMLVMWVSWYCMGADRESRALLLFTLHQLIGRQVDGRRRGGQHARARRRLGADEFAG